MSRTHRFVLAGLVVALAAAGCGDDPFENTRPISPREAEWLARQFGEGSLAAGSSVEIGNGGGSASAVPITFDHEVGATLDCPLGGTVGIVVALSGALDGDAGEADVDVTVTQKHAACTLQSEDGAIRMTITGAPQVVNDYDLTIREGGFEASGSMMGAFDWATDEDSGECQIDVTFTGSGALGGGSTYTLTGTVCGISVTQTVTVEGPVTAG